jgi:radical SAM protein with 4Fe4S-binding SPASM domain
MDCLREAGTLYLTFSGGEPLLRDDFFDLYAYARGKGFLINIFTNGSLISDQTISFLSRNPPLAIEISLHSLKRGTYGKITNAPFADALPKLKTIIKKLHRANLNVVIKVNGMKENQNEILSIKKFTEQLLGEGRFTFDHFIFPRLDGNKAPCRHRLPLKSMVSIFTKDEGLRGSIVQQMAACKRSQVNTESLYVCTSWHHSFYIEPSGLLKFCLFRDRFSSDLKKVTFSDGFYNGFKKIDDEKFKSNTQCAKCSMRRFCLWCPSLAFLEKKNEEASLPYLCQLTQKLWFRDGAPRDRLPVAKYETSEI